MRLTHIHPMHLRTIWSEIHPMIQAVKDRCDARWLPEDVYALIQSGAALLYAAYGHPSEGDICGVLVVRKVREWDEEALEAWICWHQQPGITIANYWDDVVEIAKMLGLTKIRAAGPRAYDRVLPMKALYTIFECDLNEAPETNNGR